MNQAKSLEENRGSRRVAVGLGDTHCTSCGEPVQIVGALRVDGPVRDCCEYCAKRYELSTALETELAAAIQAWIDSCKRRRITSELIHDAVDFIRASQFDFGSEEA